MATVLTALTAAGEVNAYYSYLPNVSDVVDALLRTPPPRLTAAATDTRQPHPAGLTLALPVPDRGSGFGASTAWVWLPPQYFTRPTSVALLKWVYLGWLGG